MWSDIKKEFPDATLDICYGWQVYDMIFANNPERQLWKSTVMSLMQQDGITDHGKLGKKALKELRKTCGIWAYPTHFTEINCINALEMQSDGVVPVTMNLAALQETVQSGIKVEGDIYDPKVKDEYLKKLLELMHDPEKWSYHSKRGIAFAKSYDWNRIATKWAQVMAKEDQSVKLTVYTPTIRQGFWNIMADNLSIQTYKNFEWLIVDDYKEDRSSIAKEYAKKYNLDIRYVRGKERAKKRSYGLVNANNTALLEAKGDLIVFLQDFILMPEDGLEQLAILYKKNPDALLAPCDMYVAPRITPDTKSEDWFNGELDVIGDFIRQNARIQNKGLRESTNPYDFEQNYGAIPKKIAEELGGWYEVYDEGLGYDNTDIGLRAIMSGYRILIDENNIGICIDHVEALKEDQKSHLGRARLLNDPRFIYMSEMLQQGKLPVKRTQEIDDTIDLLYDIPDEVKNEDMVGWINKNGPEIVQKWMEK
jgi:GT2 family glycosyltransferase